MSSLRSRGVRGRGQSPHTVLPEAESRLANRRGILRNSCLALLAAFGCQAAPLPESGVRSASEEWTETHQVAWEVVASSELVTLITLDRDGQPQARLLESLPPDSARMDIWMGTNRNSAKVRELRNNDRATLVYRIPGGVGYVTLRGRATIVDDPVEKERRWRPHWEAFYPDRAAYVLIHFEPEDGEVVSFPADLVGDSITWAAPEFRF